MKKLGESEVTSLLADLESPVCDLANMAALVTSHLEHLLNPSKRGDQVILLDSQADLAIFAMYQVDHLARSLKNDFYTALEGAGYRV